MAKKNKEPSPSQAVPVPDEKWKVEDALRDLKRAEAHKQDPELMKKVGKLLKSEKKQIRSLEDVVAYKNEKYGPNGSGDDEAEE